MGYFMENLSNVKKSDVLEEFQTFLLDKKLSLSNLQIITVTLNMATGEAALMKIKSGGYLCFEVLSIEEWVGLSW